MSTLEVLGREHSGDEALCFTVNGYETSATTAELATLRRRFQSGAKTVEHDGIRLDETQVTHLIEQDSQPQVLWPLEACHCGADASVLVEGKPTCAGHAAARDSLVEEQIDDSMEALR